MPVVSVSDEKNEKFPTTDPALPLSTDTLIGNFHQDFPVLIPTVSRIAASTCSLSLENIAWLDVGSSRTNLLFISNYIR